jgi:cystathionine beta-lyase/cystathionine gamma-synthase
MSKPSLYTTAVHAGERAPRPHYTPVATPIYPSASYIYEDIADLDGIFGGTQAGPVYTRYGNPTNEALEAAVAALEGSQAALSFGSGMAAIHASLLAAGAVAGKTVVAAQDVYGATYALLNNLFAKQGVTTHFVDVADLEGTAQTIAATRPVAVLAETISNPLLKVADLPRLAELAHGAGAALIVDNTFATPCLCRPIEMGADYVVHSATKYLGGHGDVLGGVVATSAANRQVLFEIIKMTGGNLGPQEAWLVLRGLKTLPLRVTCQCANAAGLAAWLAGHGRISHVNYPGLPDHPQHSLAARMLDGGAFGAMISFDIRDGDQAAVFRFMNALGLVLPATTLGDVYSLTLYPAGTSHRALDAATRRRVGIGDGLVRLSVGIEAVEDIMADLDQALEAC